MTKDHHLIVIVGPTGIGKTDLSIELAEHFHTEILSADSRQFFREMETGTAKPDTEQLSRVKHHFINSLSIHEDYNAGKFEEQALEVLETLFKSQQVVIMVGGSGLYVKAICEGMDNLPEVGEKFRRDLIHEFEQKGLEYLQSELKLADPEYYELVDLNNRQRLIRALEVYRASGQKFSGFLNQPRKERPFSIHKIGLTMDREQLYDRIDRRMDMMLEKGLLEEAKGFFPDRHLNALQTVGYSEIFSYLAGEYDWEEAVRLLKRNSRRYAKRQLTWFRRDEEVKWFDVNQRREIQAHIDELVH